MPFNENIAECFPHKSQPVINLLLSLYWYRLIQIKLVYFQILQKQSSDFLFEVGISYAVLNDNMKHLLFPNKGYLISHYRRKYKLPGIK